MPGLQGDPQAEGRRLLRLLLVWHGQMSADPERNFVYMRTLPIMLCVIALLNGCGRPAGKTESPVTVQTIRPHRGEIVRRVTLPGNVRAIQEATLYAKVAGYLKTINVDKGDAVKEGDLLAEIDAPEMVADLARFKADADAAETEFKRTSDAQQKAPDLITPLALDSAKAKHEMAQASLIRIRDLLAYAKITAPFTGIVTKRWVD